MKQVDAAVIGGGILGCFTARNLRRWRISTLLIEKEDDVCREISKSNSAIVYAGYDNKPGSLKAQMTVRGNANMEQLCAELEVPFDRCGSMMVSFGEKGEQTLRKKLEQGRANGVPGLELLTGEEARVREPMLSENVTAALYSPTTGTVNPWQLGIAAYVNALQNGCEAWLGTTVTAITREEEGYRIDTDREPIRCKYIINCAGRYADWVQAMVHPVPVELILNGSDYIVLDNRARKPRHILFQERENGKGLTVVPCVEGNLLLDSPARPLGQPWAVTPGGLEKIHALAPQLLPELELEKTIRSFGAVRPNPRSADGKNLPDYCIETPAPDFLSFIGIKTPGLTCADELGRYAAEKCADYLHAERATDFDPRRRAIPARKEDPDWYEIVCRCGNVTKGQILEAIARGALTVDAVKRRVGSGMGRCQGSRCTLKIEKLLEEYRHGAL